MGTRQQQEQRQPAATLLTAANKHRHNPELIDHLGKHCENPDCTAPSLISLVQQHETPQLIQEPTVIEDPLLICGYTTVFQITGKQANIHNNNNEDNTNNDIDKPIYKIIPNTHAHIVNFVVVDSDGEMFRKIKENDPMTVKKLMDAQKSSADQLLDKLMCIDKSTSLQQNNKTNINNNNNTKLFQKSTSGIIKLPQKQLRQTAAPSKPTNQEQNITTSPINSNISQQSNNVNRVNTKLPFNIPSNITIRTVTPTPTTSNQQKPLNSKSVFRSRGRPRIYPVNSSTSETSQQTTASNQSMLHTIGHPNLKITSVQSIGATNSNSSSPALAEKSDLEKMREEINELRETVKRFASSAGPINSDTKKQKT